ncbi:EF-hand domain-containing protein [Celeribacter litoreus]|uniref:EF-hand domain-containing protein n=1 Tax=Celeribacter litoreus TaxID=2876714 RepID=UPI001CCA2B54|nr:EF-hand domain-containing protein [Celeribacter litoreus]MCA0042992.1 EF-hand domain-containing protein [Celeribacter litoreus]
MKRHMFVSALALVAVVGGATVAIAQAAPMQGRQMQQGQAMGGMPFGPQFDFASIDTNEDGKITQDEIDAMKAARFAEIDADGNGTVDADELFAHQEAQRIARQQARAAQMIASRDADGDGVLSQEELQNRPQFSLFDRLDADGDGALSEDELANAQQRRMGAMMGQNSGKMGRGMERMGGQHDHQRFAQMHGQRMMPQGGQVYGQHPHGPMQGQGMAPGMGQGMGPMDGTGPMNGQPPLIQPDQPAEDAN